MGCHRTSLGVIVLLFFLLINLPVAIRADGGLWVKYSGNPVITPTPGTWDADYVAQPRVLFDGSEYRMWYVGSSQKARAIGFASSADGVTWTKSSGPVLAPGPEGAWDGAFVGLGSVVWDGNRFLMWYVGAGFTSFQTGAVGMATSPDGINWGKYAGNPVLRPSSIDQRLITTPYVIKPFGSPLYNMWYAARRSADPPSSSVLRIIYATSLDGINWDKFATSALSPSDEPSAWDSGSVYAPSVFYDNYSRTFGMWYTGLSQASIVPNIGFAISKDGIAFTNSTKKPLLSQTAGAWDSGGVENQDVILTPTGFTIYYDGISVNAGNMIGLARAPQGFAIPEFPASNTVLILTGLTLMISFIRKRKKS